MKRRGLPATLLDPSAPQLCCCESCIALGGRTRARIKARERAATLRWLDRNERSTRATAARLARRKAATP